MESRFCSVQTITTLSTDYFLSLNLSYSGSNRANDVRLLANGTPHKGAHDHHVVRGRGERQEEVSRLLADRTQQGAQVHAVQRRP